MRKLLFSAAVMGLVAGCGLAAAAAEGDADAGGGRWTTLQKPEAGFPAEGQPGAFLARLRASVDMGQAKHVEETELTGLRSDWEAFLARTRLVADVRLPGGFELSGEASGFFTAREGEEWRPDDLDEEDQQLRITGWELRALFGWGFDVEDVGRFSLLTGISGRSLDLKRESEVFDEESTTESDLAIWEVEGRMVLPVKSDFMDIPVTIEASASYGRLISPEADIEGGGTIEGDGGWIFRARAGAEFELSRRFSVWAGGFYEFLKIEGGVNAAGDAEWPDSESTAGGGELGLTFRF